MGFRHIKILEMDQNTNILQIRCKVCQRHKEALLRQADALGLRGVAKDGIVKYADGLVFTVLKTNIWGHVAGTLSAHLGGAEYRTNSADVDEPHTIGTKFC